MLCCHWLCIRIKLVLFIAIIDGLTKNLVGGAGAAGGEGDAHFPRITSWSGRGRVGLCCALAALAGAGGGSGNCVIGGGGAALVSLGVGVRPLMRWLALRVRGAGDACVAFDVHCDSFAADIDDDCDCVENDMHNNDDDYGANVKTRAKNGAMTRVWGTTMTLFDERGKMRSEWDTNCRGGMG